MAGNEQAKPIGAIGAIGVVGAGTMGSGIAVTVARGGYPVVLCDSQADQLERGLAFVRNFFDRSTSLGRLTEGEAAEATARVRPVDGPGQLGDCGIVIEAISENLAAKRALFDALLHHVGPETAIHTNTSTLTVGALAEGSPAADRVVATHYCNPAPLTQLVEVAAGPRTAPQVLVQADQFVASLGKTGVRVPDIPGFIVNRLVIPYENDAIRLLASGAATAEAVDSAVALGLGYPMGPFRLLDIVGLDVHRDVSRSMYEQTGDERFVTPPLVEEMINAGRLGRKTGRGFYEYAGNQRFGEATGT